MCTLSLLDNFTYTEHMLNQDWFISTFGDRTVHLHCLANSNAYSLAGEGHASPADLDKVQHQKVKQKTRYGIKRKTPNSILLCQLCDIAFMAWLALCFQPCSHPHRHLPPNLASALSPREAYVASNPVAAYKQSVIFIP